MTEGTGHLVWTLVRLRYKLIWAQARRSPARVVVLIVVTFSFAVIAVLFGLMGLAAAIAGAQLGRTELITRGVLTGFHASAVLTSLFFGLGPRAAFSEHALRRFPLTSRERLLVRHLIGLIDPIWCILVVATFGIAIGLAITGKGSLLLGLVAALLFVVIAYLTAVFVMSLVDRLMQTSTGSSLLATVGLGVLSFSGLGLSWFIQPDHPERLAIADRVLRFAPSGLATKTMVGGGFESNLVALALLVAWTVGLLTAVGWLEQNPTSRGAASSVSTEAHNFDTAYDRVARLFGSTYAPLVGKSLRYYLRSNRVRFGLATAPLFAFFGRLLSHDRGHFGNTEFYFTVAFFAFLGFSGPSSIALNQFGSDGNGVRRYAILPVRFALPVRAGSLSAILLGLAVLFPTLWLWTLLTSVPVDWRVISMLLGSSLGGLFIFNGLAMLTTLLSPKAVDFLSTLNNRLPLGGNLVVMGGLLAIFAINFLLMRSAPEKVLLYWWVSAGFAILGLAVYLVCWWAIGPIAEARRNRVIDAVSS